MTTYNQALFDCLEDYMDELIERFEEYAKKSLVLITAALASIVILAMYFLRQASAPSPPSRIQEKTGSQTCVRGRELTLKCSRSGARKHLKEKHTPNVELFCDKGIGSTAEPCTQYHTKKPSRPLTTSRSSADEKLIREIKLSTCSKTCSSCHRQSASNISPNCSKTSQKPAIKASTKPPNADANTCTSYIPPAFTPSCMPKHHLSKSRKCSKYIGIRTSCCSLCCYDDDRL